LTCPDVPPPCRKRIRLRSADTQLRGWSYRVAGRDPIRSVADASLLSDVNRWVGVGIAVVGAVVVAPSGTRLLVQAAWVWLRRQGVRTRGQLARFLPFLRRDVNVQGVTASIGIGLGSVGTLTVSGRAWHPTAPVDERIDALHQHITEVEGLLNEVSQQLSQETSKRERPWLSWKLG